MTTAEKPIRGSLLEKLMATIRSEFRTEVYVPVPNDPVFISDQCIVADCDRTAEALQQRLCGAHSQRFRKQGYSSMAQFLANPGPPTRGRKALAACVVTECRHARWDRNGLCRKHSDRWKRAGRPDLASWEAPDVTPSDLTAECRLPFCDLWAESPRKLFCSGHDDRWVRHGRPDIEQFILDCGLVGTAHIDLRALAPQLRLEIQYALQCRHDTRSRTAAPRLVMPAIRLVHQLAVTSLLNGQKAVLTYWHRPLHAMTDAFATAGFRTAVISEPPPAPGARELFPDALAKSSSGAFLSFLFFVLEAV